MSSRSARNSLLAAAAGIGVVAGVLEVTGHSLDFAFGLSTPFYPKALSVADGLDVLTMVLFAGGFALALIGFLRVAQPSRRRLLGIAATLFLASGLSTVAVHLIRAVEYGTHDVPGKFTASEAVQAAAGLPLAAAGLIAAVALLSPTAGREPNRGLGWAGIGLAAFFGLDFVATLLSAIGYSDLLAPSEIASGQAVAAAGNVVAAGGAVLVAVAFLIVASSAHGRPGWLASREGWLAAATVDLALGFLLVAIGGMIVAGATFAGEDGKVVAGYWLEAVSWLGLAFAAVCASVGFVLSRNASRQAQSIPAADPEALGSA